MTTRPTRQVRLTGKTARIGNTGRQKVTLAAVTGIFSGMTRAIIAAILEHLTLS